MNSPISIAFLALASAAFGGGQSSSPVCTATCTPTCAQSVANCPSTTCTIASSPGCSSTCTVTSAPLGGSRLSISVAPARATLAPTTGVSRLAPLASPNRLALQPVALTRQDPAPQVNEVRAGSGDEDSDNDNDNDSDHDLDVAMDEPAEADAMDVDEAVDASNDLAPSIEIGDLAQGEENDEPAEAAQERSNALQELRSALDQQRAALEESRRTMEEAQRQQRDEMKRAIDESRRAWRESMQTHEQMQKQLAERFREAEKVQAQALAMPRQSGERAGNDETTRRLQARIEELEKRLREKGDTSAEPFVFKRGSNGASIFGAQSGKAAAGASSDDASKTEPSKVRTYNLPGGRGYVVVSPDGRTTAKAFGLKSGDGQVYSFSQDDAKKLKESAKQMAKEAMKARSGAMKALKAYGVQPPAAPMPPAGVAVDAAPEAATAPEAPFAIPPMPTQSWLGSTAPTPAASDDAMRELTNLIREMSQEVKGLREELHSLRDDLHSSKTELR